ncbi:hypothetical protein E2562_037725, partial [Oryza meyeriana var. granulata]
MVMETRTRSKHFRGCQVPNRGCRRLYLVPSLAPPPVAALLASPPPPPATALLTALLLRPPPPLPCVLLIRTGIIQEKEIGGVVAVPSLQLQQRTKLRE